MRLEGLEEPQRPQRACEGADLSGDKSRRGTCKVDNNGRFGRDYCSDCGLPGVDGAASHQAEDYTMLLIGLHTQTLT